MGLFGIPWGFVWRRLASRIKAVPGGWIGGYGYVQRPPEAQSAARICPACGVPLRLPGPFPVRQRVVAITSVWARFLGWLLDGRWVRISNPVHAPCATHPNAERVPLGPPSFLPNSPIPENI